MAYKIVCLAALALASCADNGGVRVRTVEVPVESLQPCPATRPERPEPLGPLPSDAIAALATVSAKLAEWSGPGGYGDWAEAYFDACPNAPVDITG